MAVMSLGWQEPGFATFWGSMMADLKDPRLIYLKGALFLLSGCLAAGMLLAERFELRTAFLLIIAIWCFARAYYFAFYVIEHYVDSGYKYAGLIDFAKYLIRRRSAGRGT
jgi:MFS-type transporter involved in bile tolerance (Atg22 family)